MSAPNLPDPSLVRGLTQRRLGRRDVLRLSGLSAAGLALAACGVQGKGKPAASVAPDAVAKYWTGKAKVGHVDFANWPLYMDPKHPELKKFTAQTGTKVSYSEVIQDNASWFAKIQPQLSAKRSIGYDLMVVTDGSEFSELVELGYLAKTYAGDGSFGTTTVAAYAKWQHHLGYTGTDANGIPGKVSLGKLGERTGLFTVVA